MLTGICFGSGKDPFWWWQGSVLVVAGIRFGGRKGSFWWSKEFVLFVRLSGKIVL